MVCLSLPLLLLFSSQPQIRRSTTQPEIFLRRVDVTKGETLRINVLPGFVCNIPDMHLREKTDDPSLAGVELFDNGIDAVFPVQGVEWFEAPGVDRQDNIRRVCFSTD